MQDYFHKLGEHLETAWARAGRAEDDFSEVAAHALEARPPLEGLDLEALVDAILDSGNPAPAQLAPPGAFGQPGVTVYRGRDFLVEVYFWLQSLSAIHDHPFCGAFSILQGFSVHAVYDFAVTEELGERARLGRLAPTRLELLEAGHVGAFGQRRHALIHALLHVPIPSVSMVVRTERAHGYQRYFPPGVALAMAAPVETFERPMQLLDTLRACGHPDYARRFEAFLRSADFETAFRAISRIWFGSTQAEREHWLDVASDRHGDRVGAIRAALERAGVTQEADLLRARLGGADERLIATALLLAENRDDLLALLAERHPDPVARLHAFVDEADVFGPDEEAGAVIAHALIDGLDLAATIRRLVDSFGEAAIGGREAEVRACHAGCAFAMLGR